MTPSRLQSLSRSPRRPAAAAAALACAALLAAPAALAQVAFSDPPADHHFGPIPVGATYATQAFTVSNGSRSPVSLGPVAIDGQMATCAALQCPVVAPGDFAVQPGSDGCSGTRLAPGANCSVTVSFVPTAGGPRTARLSVPVEGGAPLVRTLLGTGTTALDCVLDWAERQYPQLLTQPTPTLRVPPFHARCYAGQSLCLGADSAVPTFDQPSLYLYQQGASALQNLGYLSAWAQQAQCR